MQNKHIIDEKGNLICPPHNLSFDEEKFLDLLKDSLSFSPQEKLGIVERVSHYSQAELNLLLKTLIEEEQKLLQLHKNELKYLAILIRNSRLTLQEAILKQI